MKTNLLKNTFIAITAALITLFTLPFTAQAQTTYNLKIAGTQVTSDNCADLSGIEGVSGTVTYAPETNTLTLDNATITTDKKEGLYNKIDGLTIVLVGENTITSTLDNGIYNFEWSSITFSGNGKLTVKGETTSNTSLQAGILNHGTITVKDCTLQAEGGVYGLTDGRWIFDRCTVRAKGNGSESDPYAGSIRSMWYKEPEFKECSITSPTGTEWKSVKKDGTTYFYLCTKDGKPVTDWVTIKPVTEYNLKIAGTQVHSANCADLSAISGVKGKAHYNPDTQTLTLENAHITATVEEYENGGGLYNRVDNLTIVLVGNNTITAEKGRGISNELKCALTLTGNGKLTVKGATTGKENHQEGILNRGTLTVKDCTLQVEGGIYGLGFGDWVFDHCTVRAKGRRSYEDLYAGSISWIWSMPEFIGCSITSPVGAKWKEHDRSFTLCTKDDKPVTDWVTIEPSSFSTYNLWVSGTQVTSENCDDLTGIDGVKGKAHYNPDTQTLTLENAHITATAEEYENGRGLFNKIDGLTIVLVGNNTITAEKNYGIYNEKHCSLTGNGKLTVKGAMTSFSFPVFQRGILNRGTLTVKDCTLEAEGGVYGLTEGHWIFDHCTIRAKGGGKKDDPYAGSICWMWDIPQFKGCAITAPVRTIWKKHDDNDDFTLCTPDGKPVTDWVTIEPSSFSTYNLWVSGTQVTSENCADLTGIDGVKGKAHYDPDTQTLTLENAHITNTAEEDGYGLVNKINGLNIVLVGNNTITSEKNYGIYNKFYCSFTGNGKLTVKGAMTDDEENQVGIFNNGTITVKGCILEAEGGVYGLAGNSWIFDHCTVRAKGGGNNDDPNVGSISWMWNMPEFIGCSITSPAGAKWKERKYQGRTYFTLYTADDKPVTDWVTISPDATAIDTPTADTAQRGIYTLTGLRLEGDFHQLPAGVYIVNGRKVVKQ